MPKHIIEFKMPEERDELLMAQKGCDYRCALAAMAEHFRAILKHQEHSEERTKTIEELREKFLQIIEDYDIYLW